MLFPVPRMVMRDGAGEIAADEAPANAPDPIPTRDERRRPREREDCRIEDRDLSTTEARPFAADSSSRRQVFDNAGVSRALAKHLAPPFVMAGVMPTAAGSPPRTKRHGIFSLAGTILLLATLALSATDSAGDRARARVRAEIDRLSRESAKLASGGGDSKATADQLAPVLESANRSQSAGRFYAALEGAGRVRVGLGAAAEMSGRSGKTAEEFDAFWSRTRADLAADRKSSGSSPSDLPAAVEALAQAAEGQVLVLADASRAYERVTGPEAGFYYLGQARSDADWAAFCRSLEIRRAAAPAPLRSIAPELARLQQRANAAFQPPLSIDRHPQFIRFNATLKLAGELEAQGRRAGALYEYLDAVQQLAAIAPAKRSASESLESARKRLAASPRDESLGLLFVERAEAAAGSPAGPAAAEAILGEVLPAYAEALAPGPPVAAPAAPAITITLVRWPYT